MTFSHVFCHCIGIRFCVRTGEQIMKRSLEQFYQGKQDAMGREKDGFYKVTKMLMYYEDAHFKVKV